MEIGHGVELDRPAAGRGEGIVHGPTASPAASDQGQADRVVFRGVDHARCAAEHGRAGRERAGLPEELPASGLGWVDGSGHLILLVERERGLVRCKPGNSGSAGPNGCIMSLMRGVCATGPNATRPGSPGASPQT